jgi:NTE family protein
LAGERTALVLAGGGARGAYEAGALSLLLPELERRGQRPSVYAGTSVGAINVAVLAASAHLPAEEAANRLVALWSELDKSDVIRPILRRQGPLAALRFAGELLSIPGVRLPSVLDPTPLHASLDRWIDWDALHRNIRDGLIDTVAAVCTSARTGRSVVFVEEREERVFNRSHAVAYVAASVEREHVLASAAIPLLFPPILVESPARARGWYFDGGTRLNAPIKPALDLGADRLVVIASDSIAGPTMDLADEDTDAAPPDIGDGVLHLLEGALVDPLIEDMRTLGNVNAFFAEGDQTGPRLYRSVRGKAPYRRVPYVFVGPSERGAVGRLASSVFSARYGGIRGALRAPDFQLITRLIGGESATHGELLSLLFFDSAFTRELIDLGRADAERWLADMHDGGEGPWQVGPLANFVMPRQWTAG